MGAVRAHRHGYAHRVDVPGREVNMSIVDRIFRFGEGRKLRAFEEIVTRVSSLAESVRALTDVELRTKTDEFKGRLARGESLDDLLPEAFAVAREAAERVVGMRPFDVQVMGAVVLHRGSIAEMKTGEGKTLVATMPVYLNALSGKGVHVVTVNDYLAKRDTEWMGPIYEFLGLTVGALQSNMPQAERVAAYQCDVVHGTNTEFGFDYLRDNMALSMDQRVQRGYHYAIVDEVDSILIDEARTPLIISGPGERAAKTYYDFARIARQLKEGEDEDYEVDEKKRTVAPTEKGVAKVERMYGVDNLYEDLSGQLVNHLVQALKSQALFKRDVDYLVADGEVKIIDEFTGRVLEGRRYSEGLHQAIEAKEGVRIKEENQTLATITLQNYVRLYDKLAGMTGTAATEADEFNHTYGMEVVIIPPNRPMIRDDANDVIYKTESAKFQAVVEDLVECYQRRQPVLVGTISVEKSERLSAMLNRRGIPHEVLNAKQHAREASIVAQAGQPGAITIATNMAGRGTDIKLGEGVADLGGLYVLGTERHESRRIDNQLRGRSGRQGDPGLSRFYISLEDDLMRLFGGDRIFNIMERLGVEEDQPIEHSLISRSVETAQKRVEEQNFQIRKRVLEYDDVMNKQREVVYAQRQRILEGQDLREDVRGVIEHVLSSAIAPYTSISKFPEEWDLTELFVTLRSFYAVTFGPEDLEPLDQLDADDITQRVIDDAFAVYDRKEEDLGYDNMRELERWVLLRTLDAKWRDHLYEMDYLREGIGLRALAQKDPLVEYKSEGYRMYTEMMEAVQADFVRYLFHLEIVRREAQPEDPRPVQLVYSGGDGIAPARSFGGGSTTGVPAGAGGRMNDSSARAYQSAQAAARTVTAPRRVDQKVGRNDPCPCGSGKKFKRCCGA